MAGTEQLLEWLRDELNGFAFDVVATYRRSGDEGPTWPLTAHDADDLETQLVDRGHLLPRPKEPAALAHVLEVAIVDHLVEVTGSLSDVEGRGAARSAATPTSK